MREPGAINENGIIINADQLKRYWANRYDQTERARAAMFRALRDEERLEESPPEQIIVHRHSNMSPLESDLLQQTAGKLEHVSKTLAEHLNYRKPQPKPTGSRGMQIE